MNIPLLGGIALSGAIHVAAFYGADFHSAPKPHMQTGKTVVQLTLLPSVAINTSVQTPAPTPTTVAEPREATNAPIVDSMELDASPIEEKGVIADAAATSTIQPVYPRMSRRRGEEGTVILSVEVLAAGSAGAIKTIESSGYKRLDEAAWQAAHDSTYTPAARFGQNIDSTIELTFTFRLTDD